MALVRKCVVTEPSFFEEALEDHAWVDAMVEEYDSIVRNSAWEIVPRSEGKSVVGLRWIYKVKQVADESVEKYKARFVARGFSQIEGIDYEETFAPIARLKRALYGLKQAPRAWYTWIDSYFTRLVFSKSEADPNLYYIVVEGNYAREVLEKSNMHGCKPVDTPLPRGWRKEDATSAKLSQAMVKPTKLFWKANKHVLRYLIGTLGYGLWYRQEDEVKLCGFTDADWAGSPTDRKSTSGGIFSIRLTTVSWYSRKQRSVALNSLEAEYMATSLAACEAIWMRKIMVGLFRSHLEPTVIYCDNQSCIKLSTNPVFHDRSKNIDIRYHHIRDCVQQRIMLLSYIPTEDQNADILMKVLTRRKFEYHRGRIGVADNPYLVERKC
eukprot:PITA_19921